MEKTIRLLAVLLGAQLILAIGLVFTGPDLSAQGSRGPLLAVKPDQVDRLTVEGPDHAKVVLARSGGIWRVPDAVDFPADGNKVQELLERIAALQHGLPVATSSGAQDAVQGG